MRPTFRKLEVKDIGDLERLVADNVEGIEPGLKVIDSRLLLGQAAIDLVGLDAKGSLVLIALDFSADEGLLLRVMDAYSWCLEYPDALRRLYPVAQVAPGHPPRILFIVERLTDSFVRRIKQLSFLEIDCLEFRHLEVNGASGLYFDLVQRLRRPSAGPPASLESESRGLEPLRGPEAAASRPAPSVLPTPPAAPEPDVAADAPSVAPAPTPVVERDITTPPIRVAPAEPVVAQEPAPEPVETEPVAELEPVTEPGPGERPLEATPSVLEEPRWEAPAPAAEPEQTPPPARDEITLESAGEAARQTEPLTPLLDPAKNPEWRALLEQLGIELSKPAGAPTPEAEPTATAHEEAEAAMVAQAPEEPQAAPEPAAPAAPPAAPAPAPVQTPAWAKPAAQSPVAPSAGRTYFFAQAVKGTPTPEAPAAAAPAPRPAAAGPQPSSAPVARPAPVAPKAEPSKAPEAPAEAPAGLEALNFPKDGLSRQWLEFLNQLSATK